MLIENCDHQKVTGLFHEEEVKTVFGQGDLMLVTSLPDYE
jgi:hypothetical protein